MVKHNGKDDEPDLRRASENQFCHGNAARERFFGAAKNGGNFVGFFEMQKPCDKGRSRERDRQQNRRADESFEQKADSVFRPKPVVNRVCE